MKYRQLDTDNQKLKTWTDNRDRQQGWSAGTTIGAYKRIQTTGADNRDRQWG